MDNTFFLFIELSNHLFNQTEKITKYQNLYNNNNKVYEIKLLGFFFFLVFNYLTINYSDEKILPKEFNCKNIYPPESTVEFGRIEQYIKISQEKM